MPDPQEQYAPTTFDWHLEVPIPRDVERQRAEQDIFAQAFVTRPGANEVPPPTAPVPDQPVERPMTAQEILQRPPGRRTTRQATRVNTRPEQDTRWLRADQIATPPPLPRVPAITDVRIQTVHADRQTLAVRSLYTTETGAQDQLDFNIYADTGRTMMPYAEALINRIAATLRGALDLPLPPRREFPNPTVGERMYSMLGLLADRMDDNPALAQELQALCAEYENAARNQGGLF
jgi:hypothetical protein